MATEGKMGKIFFDFFSHTHGCAPYQTTETVTIIEFLITVTNEV